MNFFYRLSYAVGTVIGRIIVARANRHEVYQLQASALDDIHCRYEICGVPECGQVIGIPLVVLEEDGRTRIDPDWMRLAMLEHQIGSPILHPEVAEVGERFDIFGEES